MKFTIIKREPDDDLGVEAKIKRWGKERSEQSVFQSKSLMSDGGTIFVGRAEAIVI